MPDLGDEEIAAVVRTMKSGWVTSGPEMASFEREFADFVGGDVEAVATNSATAGLHLALEACGVGPGDEVIVPTWTFTATAEVVRYLGATPILIDVDERTLLMNLDHAGAAITPQTRAILPVHMAGLSVDMPTLHRVVGRSDISIIEDAAHALPTVGDGKPVGSAAWSSASVFSFYANKTMTTGEGGMVTSRDPRLVRRMKTMRLHGIDRDVFDRYRSQRVSWAYDVVAPGFKYNMPDTAAAMGRVQLRRVHAMRERRARVVERYREAMSDLPVLLPPDAPETDLHAWHLFIIQLADDAGISRDDFVQSLASRGIGSSVHFIPLHRHSYWRESLAVSEHQFPAANRVFQRAVSLPLFSGMGDSQVDRVIAAVREVLE